MPAWHDRQIVIAGAGAVGGYVGGMLAAAGRDVVLLGREEPMRRIAAEGLRLTNLEGLDRTLSPRAVSDPQVLAGAGLILVTVKSGGTAEMAGLIAAHAPEDVIVISLQNGVVNPRVLREALPGRTVLAGMVPFNIVWLGPTHLHRGSAGQILIGAGNSQAVQALSAPGLPVAEAPGIEAVQWGKLLINLNNALNALSGLPLRDQLLSPGWRRLLAAQIDEARAVLKAAGIPVRSPLPLPIGLFPTLLRLPTFLFMVAAKRTLPVDPKARSSMWDDLERRRATEIDALQGEVMALAERHRMAVPLIGKVAALVKQAEAAKAGPPGLTPDVLKW